MKIGVLIDRLNVGGIEKIAIEEVKALRELGEDAHLLVLRRAALVEGAFSDLLDDVPITYLDDKLPRLLRFSFRIPLFYFFSLFHLTYPMLLAMTVRRGEYDFVLSHNHFTSFTAIAWSRWKAVPFGLYLWDPVAYLFGTAYKGRLIGVLSFITTRLATLVDRWLVRRATVVFLSGRSHLDYLSRLIDDPGKVHLIFLGHRYRGTLPAARGSYVVSVTAWKEAKHLEDLIDVVAQVPRLELKIGGRWIHKAYLAKIESLINQLGVADRVTILGGMEEGDLDDLYANARVSVTVNAERGFGLPALEAASNGCPFIIPRDSGVAEFFENGTDGFYFEFGDMSTLKQLLAKTATDERFSYEMGRHAWEKVKEQYSWKKHAERLMTSIRPLVLERN